MTRVNQIDFLRNKSTVKIFRLERNEIKWTHDTTIASYESAHILTSQLHITSINIYKFQTVQTTNIWVVFQLSSQVLFTIECMKTLRWLDNTLLSNKIFQ